MRRIVRGRNVRTPGLGPSIKYVTLCVANFDPLPSHIRSHNREPRKYVTHLGPPDFYKTQDKNPCMPTHSISIVRGGFCPGVSSGGLLSGRFYPGV